jgi:DNA-binding NtrC family response regulator
MAALKQSPTPTEPEVVAALAATGGNVTEAADVLGMSRSALDRLIEKYGIKVRDDGS